MEVVVVVAAAVAAAGGGRLSSNLSVLTAHLVGVGGVRDLSDARRVR